MQNFNLVRIIGLMFLGAGSFFIGLSFPELIKRISNNRDIFREGLAVVCALGFAYFIIGIAAMMKKKWTRKAINITLWGSILIYVYFYIELFNPPRSERAVLWAATLVIMSFLIGGILYINNEKVLAAYHEEDEDDFDDENILDL